MAKPFIKWVGGKSNLLPVLISKIPAHIQNYVEVFLGGGALFYELEHSNSIHGSVLLNDYNHRLITTYRAIKDDLFGVSKLLTEYQTKHSKEFYYEQRNRFNSLDEHQEPIEVAALFIYLNKTGFNGLYRVNRKNEFNVPIGYYKEPAIYNPSVLSKASIALQDAVLHSSSFHHVPIQEDTFYYLDPPYYKTFIQYTDAPFDKQFQLDLASYCLGIHKAGSKFMLSNTLDPWIEELYSDFNVHVVQANRQLSCNSQKRGKIDEVLITNY